MKISSAERERVAPAGGDGWLGWPLLAAVMAVGTFAFGSQWPGLIGLYLVPLASLICAGVTPAFLMWAVVLGKRQRWRGAVSILLAVAAPLVLWPVISWTVEILHLGATVGLGMGQIGTGTSRDGQIRFYDWSTGFVGGPLTFLIHDVTDRIARPNVQSSTAEADVIEECVGRVRHLTGHYYVCTTLPG